MDRSLKEDNRVWLALRLSRHLLQLSLQPAQTRIRLQRVRVRESVVSEALYLECVCPSLWVLVEHVQEVSPARLGGRHDLRSLRVHVLPLGEGLGDHVIRRRALLQKAEEGRFAGSWRKESVESFRSVSRAEADLCFPPPLFCGVR